MGTISKLEVNVPYLLYTTNDTILAKKITVVGVLNYDQALKENYSITGIAINEKVVSTDYDTTEEYLRTQLFYKCIEYDEDQTNLEDKVYLVWDDIIDLTRTTRLSSTYKFQLTLEINNNLDVSLNTVMTKIQDYIITEFEENIVPTLVQTQVVGQNDTKQLLEDYMKKFEEARSVINKMASLKQIESLIDALVSSNMITNINDINDKLTTIAGTVATISDLIS